MKRHIILILCIALCHQIYAQCICGHIRFAIDDSSHDYTYKFSGRANQDTMTVSFINNFDQLHINKSDSTKSNFSHEAYRVYDVTVDSIVTTNHDNSRKYVYFHIDYMDKFFIEVTDNETGEKMQIDFTKRGYDTTYNILTDFVPGNFEIDLSAVLSCYLDAEENIAIYGESEIIGISPDNKLRRTSKYDDWMKITNMFAFWKEPEEQ